MLKTRVSRPRPVELKAGGRDPMPEPTFLQIQGGGNPTTRMIELPPGPVRIGRGSHCEVRLGDAGLGEVHCLLRRRGGTWHFQPVGPAGHVWIDGRAADQQRPVPLGVPFRVGDHWLILRPADSATNDWGTSEASIVAEAEPVLADPEPSPSPEPEPVTAPMAAAADLDHPRPESTAPPSGEDEERLRRWEARLQQRERWLKDRQEERRWEARWKSAGESIRSRATPPPAPPRAPAPSPPPTPRPVAADRPMQTPPVARIIEPRGAEPIRRGVEPAPRPQAPRVVERPLVDPPAPIRRPAAPAPSGRAEARPLVAGPETPPAPPSRSLVMLVRVPERPPEPSASPPPHLQEEGLEVVGSPEAWEPGPSASPLPSGEEPGGRGVSGLSAPERAGITDHQTGDHPHPGSLPVGEGGRKTASQTDGQFAKGDAPEPGSLEAPRRIESASWLDETLPIAIEEARRAEVAPTSAPIESPREVTPVVTGREWPSARAIFAAQGRRVEAGPLASRPVRRKVAEPEPTEILGPACWSMPLWLGWFPVLAASLILGAGGIGLACQWAVGANEANLAIRLATRPEGSTGSPIDPALIPRGGWWTSSATHRAAWALALVRAEDGEDHSEEVRSLLEASRVDSQLGSRSRFVVELPESPATDPGSTPGLSHLGRTRDVVTLVWTGRRLRREGKPESAIRAFRSAMEIASKASVGDLDPPNFFEDPQVRRYALPREALLGFVARAMAESGDWTAEQWNEALPPSATASMVASRAFAAMGKRPEADRLADLAIRQAEGPTPLGFDPAEDRAAGAEALACRGRWAESSVQYRQAIDLAEDDATRRRWWLNLAEVAQRTNDDSGRTRAIEAAKLPSTIDEITRRALKYQQGLPGLISSGVRN